MACLWLYPAAFRRAYSREMVILFQDCLRDARRDGVQAVMVLWGTTFCDIAVSVPRAHLEEWTMTQTPYTRSSQMGAVTAFVVVALLIAIVFGLTPMSPEHLATLLMLMVCLFVTMTAIYRRLTHPGSSLLATLGYGVGAVGTVVSGIAILLILGSGVGTNGIILLGIIFGFLAVLIGLALIGCSTATRSFLGKWRFAPLLALPLLLLILGVSAFATGGQIERLYLYELQGFLFAATISGTGIMLCTNQH